MRIGVPFVWSCLALVGCQVADVGVLLAPPAHGVDATTTTPDRDGGFYDAGSRDGGPPVLEMPEACVMIPYYGQSSSIGVCSGSCANFGDPPCDIVGGNICTVLSDQDLPGGFQAAWNPTANDYGGGVCPLNVRGGAGCSRGNAEFSGYGMIQQYRKMLGDPPQATFTSIAGQAGTSIADLDRGVVPQSDTQDGYGIYYKRLMHSIVAVRDAVAANPDQYGCDGRLVVRGLAMTQGETDDPQPEGYAERVQQFVRNFCEDVKSLTGQRNCPHISWDQTSGWNANGDRLAPTAQRLLDAAEVDPLLHVAGGRGQYNPGTPAHPFLGETNPNGVHSWENSGASPLHFSALTQKHMGRQHGKVLYRAIHRSELWDGLHIISLTQTGRILTACYNPVGGRIERDVDNCPPHWNGTDGFEWYQDEVGAPRILSVTQSTPTCLAIEMSSPVTDAVSGRLHVGFRGLKRIGPGEEPENGCRAADGTVNVGAPGWANWRDVDDADFEGDGAAYNWVAIQAKTVDRGAVARTIDSSAAYFAPDERDERIAFADDSALSSSALTVSWWAQHESDTALGIAFGKWTEFLIRRQKTGDAYRYSALFAGSGSNTSAWTTETIPKGSGWTHLAMIYDGSQVPTQRVRWFKDCVEINDTERATIPASLPNSPGAFTVGDAQAGRAGVDDGIRDVAVWPSVLGESDLLKICRSRGDLRSIAGLPPPRYFVRPTCDDDLATPGGVANLGTNTTAGSGQATEGDDRVIDRPGACNGVDAGIRDGGIRDGGIRDGGVSPTVPNIFGLACDGVDDRVTFGAKNWFDAKDEALVCFVMREPSLTNGARPIGHWETNGEQWGMKTAQSSLHVYAATSNEVERYVATETNALVAGPHQSLCVRYDLAATPHQNEVRMWRNGVPVTMSTAVGGPGSTFRSPSGPGFSLCGEHGGGANWAGVIDEVGIWLDGNVPTDAQIEREIAFDASRWDCEVPNWGPGGLATAPAADIRCRFESNFNCVDRSGVAVAVGQPSGGATFTAETACRGTYENETSLAPGAADMWQTTNWIQDPSDENLVVCWTSDIATPIGEGAVVAQMESESPSTSSWAIVRRADKIRIHVSPTPDRNDAWVEFDVAPTGRHNYCAVFNLGVVAASNKVRLVEDCRARLVVANSSPALPSSFVFNASQRTSVAGTTDGDWGWGGNANAIDNLVVWREQDGEPAYSEVLSTVCFDPARANSPNYEALPSIPPPGCWFPLDGDLSDRMTNCLPLTQTAGQTTWPTTAHPLD